MMNDDQISLLLRTALPAVGVERPSRDLWPAVVQRSEARLEVSSADWSLAAVVAIALVLFPEWFWLLAYQL
jgi:hypothetical protein